jgi:hypothetical protein
MDKAVLADKEFFGFIDYLHIFDFGRSPVYGRVSDYSHYDEIGGLDKLSRAIAGVEDMGVPVGLYIEGYLSDERGVWGKNHVVESHILRQNGEPLWFDGGKAPSAGGEHMMCPAYPVWQDFLANVYRRVSRELKPKGLYIDEHGFGEELTVCWSRNHGHPVPWAPIRPEFELGRKIRQAVPPEIATLTEQVPTDVTSQVQDGALSYSVTGNDVQLSPHRADLFRFVFPDFKIIQLISYGNYRDGNWGALKFPFFNGEGWWISNPIPEGVEPAARDFLRRALRVVHEHIGTFRTDRPEPLVPTSDPLIFANAFPGAGETVWTLFNADYRTHRGPVIEVNHVRGATYEDAWSGVALTPVIRNNRAVLPLTIGPREVGCIVQRRPRQQNSSNAMERR